MIENSSQWNLQAKVHDDEHNDDDDDVMKEFEKKRFAETQQFYGENRKN